MTISLRLRGQAVAGVKVSASGAGVNASGTTNQLGRVRLLVLAKKPGIFKITAPGVLACSKRVLAGH